MKMCVVIVAVAGFSVSSFAQGSLTPPGAPAPTMKTLEQVEARTPVSGAMTLSQSGSYYLTGNVTNGGITVSASDVTLDLNGFSIIGNSSGNGIAVNGVQNVVVRNGSVRGFSIEVLASGTIGCRFEKLVVSESDTTGFYFNGAGGACNANTVEACTVIGNGERGIHFIGNVGECSFNLVKDCAIGNNNGDGIYFEGQSAGSCNENRVVDSLIVGNSDRGVLFNGTGGSCSGNEIAGCRISRNLYGGISMGAGCNDNRILDNTIVDNSGSAAGLAVLGSSNLISGNIVKGNTSNYDFSEDNQLNLLISEIPESLDWPCSVKLTGSLTSSGDGITITMSGVTVNLAGFSLSGDGIKAWGATNAPLSGICIKNGLLRDYYTGVNFVQVNGSRLENLIVRNTCVGHDDNFSLDAADTYGPEITAPGEIGSTNPWANFSF